jgi:hypothetical protein
VTHDPKGIAHAIATTQNMANPAATMQRVQGPPGPQGEPTTVPLGEANVAGTMPTGLSAAQQISTEQMGKDQLKEGNYTAEIYPLEQAHDTIKDLQDKYGKGITGPGTEGRQKFWSSIATLPGGQKLADLFGFDAERLKKYAETDKYLTQGMQTRAAGLGTHSDQQLASAIRGSPNVGINDLAVDELTTAQIALRRAEHAQVLEAANKGGPNYADERSKWDAKNDIRAFAIDRMDPDARDKLISSLKKGSPEWTKFNHSMGFGIKNHIIPPTPGARSGRDVGGKQAWFTDDPSRPGKYMQFVG